MKKIIYLSLILILTAAVFFSCEVALGEMLNLDPPMVEITTPLFMENIGDELVITGTAKDRKEVVLLSITVERVSKRGNPWKMEYRADRGSWAKRSGGTDAPWASTDEGAWEIEGTPAKINWSLTIDTTNTDDGEFLITVGAVNNVNNEGPQEQRRVIVDKAGPVVKILSPVLEENYSEAKPIFDSYKLENPSIMDKLFNQDIKIQYEVEDDFSVDKIVFQLADTAESIVWESGPIEASWGGRYEIKKLDEEWLKTYLGNAPYYLQLLSTATDKAGNEKPANHGSFVYWPDSDYPWAAGIGYDTYAKAETGDYVYAESEMQLLSYDDDGVELVLYEIFYANADSTRGESVTGLVVKENVPPSFLGNTGSDFSPSTFFSFPVKAPAAPAVYLINITCIDVNNLQSKERTRYFKVPDYSIPEIVIDSPKKDISLFGTGTNGTFNLSGSVSDGAGPQSLYVAWIKPGRGAESAKDQFDYQSAESAVWSSPPAGTAVKTDSNGNKIWNLTLGAPSTADGKTTKTFTRDLTLFNDLGINNNDAALVTQTFIFMAIGNTGTRVTELHSVMGDITPPSLAISNLTIRRGGSIIENGNINANFFDNPSNNMPKLEDGDQITISGTWDDDSFNVWNDTSKIREFSVKWNDTTLSPTLGNKTWSAVVTLDENMAAMGGGRIEVKLIDYGKNMATASLSAKADTNIPVLMNITSDSPDGSYTHGKTNSTILIYLDFNKEVRYTGTASALTLTLRDTVTSNAATVTANYVSTPGVNSQRHIFSYTVANGNNFERLNVSAINTQVNLWEDAKTAGMRPNVSVGAVEGRNLGNTKQLRIDTSAPTLSSVEAMSETGYYRFGQTLYLTMTFSEDINFTPASPTNNNTVLGLNVTGSSGTGAGRNPSLMGSKQLLFTYQIQTNDNTPTSPSLTYLTANNFTIGGGSITDTAGNAYSYSGSMPTAANNIQGNKNIVIDTAVPSAPTVNGSLSSGGNSPNPQTFWITGTEADAIIEYSINNGPWLNYSGTVTISSTAKYSIRARQTDRAGNESDPSSAYEMEITRAEALLQSLGGSNPGTYTVGNPPIEIRLNLANRGTLSVTGTNPSLGLNITNFTGTKTNKTASFSKVDGNSLVFTYTIVSPDTASPLEIDALNLTGSTITAGGNDIIAELQADWDKPGRQGLSFYTEIHIKTDIPTVDTVALTNTALTITFSEDVYKGSGNITITQPTTGADDAYRAPAVMSKADYSRWGGDAVLKNYYDLGINGTTSAGVPDTTEKYILKWSVLPTDTNLVSALTGRNAHIVTIPVASGAVKVSGRVMTVDLSESWGYNLRVKGVTYNLKFDKEIVKDEQNNTLAAIYETTRLNPGVNDPFIRVEKNRGIFTSHNVPNNTTGNTEQVTYWVNLNDVATTISWSDPGAVAGQTWERVTQYRAISPPNFTTSPTAPISTQDPTKWHRVDGAPVNYWVSGATISQDSQTGYHNVAAHYSRPPYYVSATAQAGYVSARIAGHQNIFIRLAGVRTTTPPANETDWINIGNSSASGNWVNPTWIRVDYSAPFLGAMPTPANDYINYQTDTALNLYVRQSDIVHQTAWSGTQINQYWLNRSDGTWSTTSNTAAGWVPMEVTETTYIDLRTVRWNTATSGGTSIPRYYIRTDNITPTKTDMSGTAGWVSYTVTETVGGGGDTIATAVTSQPHNAQVRIDSQTPTARIRYNVGFTDRTPQEGTTANPFNGTTRPVAGAFPTVNAPATTNRDNGVEFDALTTDQAATYNGYIVGVRAYAVTTAAANTATSNTVYSKATRSVIQFNFSNVPNNWNTLRNRSVVTTNNRVLQLWLRGGDAVKGQNNTPGFPLSWDEKDYAGARLMTNVNRDSTTANPLWYWMSWEITDKAYFYFIAGTTSGTVADISANGPVNWAWGKNAWAVQQEQYPLYSGGSLLFREGTIVAQPATATFEFYDNFSGNR